MVVGAKVCDLTEDLLWFVCENFDFSPTCGPHKHVVHTSLSMCSDRTDTVITLPGYRCSLVLGLNFIFTVGVETVKHTRREVNEVIGLGYKLLRSTKATLK